MELALARCSALLSMQPTMTFVGPFGNAHWRRTLITVVTLKLS